MVSGYIKLNETSEKEKFPKSEEKVTDLLTAFHIFDAQNRGYIESRDLREALGLTVTEIPCDELKQMLKDTGLLIDRKITFEGNTHKNKTMVFFTLQHCLSQR